MNPLRMSPTTSKFLSSGITNIIISDDTCILSMQKKKLCCIQKKNFSMKHVTMKGNTKISELNI